MKKKHAIIKAKSGLSAGDARQIDELRSKLYGLQG